MTTRVEKKKNGREHHEDSQGGDDGRSGNWTMRSRDADNEDGSTSPPPPPPRVTEATTTDNTGKIAPYNRHQNRNGGTTDSRHTCSTYATVDNNTYNNATTSTSSSNTSEHPDQWTVASRSTVPDPSVSTTKYDQWTVASRETVPAPSVSTSTTDDNLNTNLSDFDSHRNNDDVIPGAMWHSRGNVYAMPPPEELNEDQASIIPGETINNVDSRGNRGSGNSTVVLNAYCPTPEDEENERRMANLIAELEEENRLYELEHQDNNIIVHAEELDPNDLGSVAEQDKRTSGGSSGRTWRFSSFSFRSSSLVSNVGSGKGAAAADVANATKKREIRIIYFLCVVLGLIVTAILVVKFLIPAVDSSPRAQSMNDGAESISPTPSPVNERTDTMVALIQSRNISKGGMILNMSSPHFKALQWMSNMDSLSVASLEKLLEGNATQDTPAPTYLLSKDQLIERYVLAILYLSTNGVEWWNQGGWYTEQDVCRWHGIECKDDNGDRIKHISMIDLGMWHF